MLALLASLVLSLLAAPPHAGNARADTDSVAVSLPRAVAETVDDAADAAVEVAQDVRRLRVRPVFSVGSLYSASKGVGVGGGIAVDALLSARDHLQVEGRLAQHLQGAYLEYRTGAVGQRPLVGVLGATGWTTDRTRFVGHGPHSAQGAGLFLDRSVARAEARLAWAPVGPRGIVLQPTARLLFDRLRGFEAESPGSDTLVLASDRARLDALAAGDRLGGEVALSAILDTRNLPAMASRGTYVEAEAARFQTIHGSALGITRVQALGIVFRPLPFRLPILPERGATFARLNGVVTRDDGEAPMPWVYLPELDRDLLVGYPRSEFVGRDAVSASVGLRGIVAETRGALLVEAVAMGTLGAAYDDVFREFTPRVQFSGGRVAVGERVPLSPSVAVGLNLHYIDRERPIVGVLVGVGPEGVSLATLRLVYGLGDYRPRMR